MLLVLDAAAQSGVDGGESPSGSSTTPTVVVIAVAGSVVVVANAIISVAITLLCQ